MPVFEYQLSARRSTLWSLMELIVEEVGNKEQNHTLDVIKIVIKDIF